MLASLNRSRARFFVALLLAILFAQAVPAAPISLDRGRGSVFSAATAEVTLPARESDKAVPCAVASPCPDKAILEGEAGFPALADRVAPAAFVWPANRQRGPPPGPPPRSIAAPREPPHLI